MALRQLPPSSEGMPLAFMLCSALAEACAFRRTAPVQMGPLQASFRMMRGKAPSVPRWLQLALAKVWHCGMFLYPTQIINTQNFNTHERAAFVL